MLQMLQYYFDPPPREMVLGLTVVLEIQKSDTNTIDGEAKTTEYNFLFIENMDMLLLFFL